MSHVSRRRPWKYGHSIVLEEGKVSLMALSEDFLYNFVVLNCRSVAEASAQTSEILTYEAEIQTAELKSIHVRNSIIV